MAGPASIAQFRRRLTLEAPTETPDGAGGVRRTFAAVAQVWGRIDPVGGEDDIRAGALGQSVTHRIALRWRAGVDASRRLRLGTRLFLIRSVWDPDERRRRLVCLCEEVKP
ncbi:tail protein [Alsobacter metallidurans]|uniref:Tail protein n=1 Tax=Alsobacter metallidurans TaxID=340221 RepID=A0A917MGZ1_9HYPH|nr:phage head closure protein [Alsobacter metallidurans]GGH13890.1 tail protein [Alsobacter metallidurans]